MLRWMSETIVCVHNVMANIGSGYVVFMANPVREENGYRND